jgi:UDP:flavonoid glycosyltransferase YjiC (YdhE family)
MNCKVVWSLKLHSDQTNIKLPGEGNPNFNIKPWQPQLEVLAHPAVVAGITHCGFGGTNDFIITGTIPILFPHFED